jgi:hypothetical protein
MKMSKQELVSALMSGRLSVRDMNAQQKKVYIGLGLRCAIGFHTYKPYYLLYGSPERDSVRNSPIAWQRFKCNN